MSDAPAGVWKSRAVVVGVFLLFFLPILGAWYLVFFTDYKHDMRSGTQHGMLIDPPHKLEDVELQDPLTGDVSRLHGKWTMFIIVNNECDQACKNKLFAMRQIRLVTGKEMHRLQRVIYFQEINAMIDAGEIFADYAGQLMLSRENVNDSFLSGFQVDGKIYDHAIYLIDPFGFLMMYYPENTEPAGVIRDIKRLLRISKLD